MPDDIEKKNVLAVDIEVGVDAESLRRSVREIKKVYDDIFFTTPMFKMPKSGLSTEIERILSDTEEMGETYIRVVARDIPDANRRASRSYEDIEYRIRRLREQERIMREEAEKPIKLTISDEQLKRELGKIRKLLSEYGDVIDKKTKDSVNRYLNAIEKRYSGITGEKRDVLWGRLKDIETHLAGLSVEDEKKRRVYLSGLQGIVKGGIPLPTVGTGLAGVNSGLEGMYDILRTSKATRFQRSLDLFVANIFDAISASFDKGVAGLIESRGGEVGRTITSQKFGRLLGASAANPQQFANVIARMVDYTNKQEEIFSRMNPAEAEEARRKDSTYQLVKAIMPLMEKQLDIVYGENGEVVGVSGNFNQFLRSLMGAVAKGQVTAPGVDTKAFGGGLFMGYLQTMTLGITGTLAKVGVIGVIVNKIMEIMMKIMALSGSMQATVRMIGLIMQLTVKPLADILAALIMPVALMVLKALMPMIKLWNKIYSNWMHKTINNGKEGELLSASQMVSTLGGFAKGGLLGGFTGALAPMLASYGTSGISSGDYLSGAFWTSAGVGLEALTLSGKLSQFSVGGVISKLGSIGVGSLESLIVKGSIGSVGGAGVAEAVKDVGTGLAASVGAKLGMSLASLTVLGALTVVGTYVSLKAMKYWEEKGGKESFMWAGWIPGNATDIKNFLTSPLGQTTALSYTGSLVTPSVRWIPGKGMVSYNGLNPTLGNPYINISPATFAGYSSSATNININVSADGDELSRGISQAVADWISNNPQVLDATINGTVISVPSNWGLGGGG